MNGWSTDSLDGESFSDHVRRHADDGVTGGKRHRKGRKRFGLEITCEPIFRSWGEDKMYYWYHTEKDRDNAYRKRAKGWGVISIERVER